LESQPWWMKWHTLLLLHSTSLLDSLDRLIENNLVNLCEEFFLKYLPVPHMCYTFRSWKSTWTGHLHQPLDEAKPLVGLSSSLACSSPLEALPDNLLLPLELLLLSGSLHCKGKGPKQSNSLVLADITQNVRKVSNTNRTQDRTHLIHFGWKFHFKSVCFTQVPVTKTHVVDFLVVDQSEWCPGHTPFASSLKRVKPSNSWLPLCGSEN
jgi:hypothetical protein